MKTMNASEFKAKCLAVMDQVATDGEPVLINQKRQARGGTAAVYGRTGSVPVRPS